MSHTAPRVTAYHSDALKVLLGSKARAQLLTLFCTHPAQEFYPRQLWKTTGLSLGHVHRELTRLAHLGLLQSRRMGREKLYRVNEQHPLSLSSSASSTRPPRSTMSYARRSPSSLAWRGRLSTAPSPRRPKAPPPMSIYLSWARLTVRDWTLRSAMPKIVWDVR